MNWPSVIRLIILLSVVNSWSSKAADLDAVLDPVAPEIRKWATVVELPPAGGSGNPIWHHYRDSKEAVDFWPASTIKLYTVVAALEDLEAAGHSLDAVLTFEHRAPESEAWVMDSARTMKEMISEVFRRSSNEDYTLLLRYTGVDGINNRLLVSERGFPHSALMRGYVKERPWVYLREEPQRVTVRSLAGGEQVISHTWSGRSYSRERGASVISPATGNCTSTQEMAYCLMRVLYPELVPPEERFRLSPAALDCLRDGDGDLVGLANRSAGAYAWDGFKENFPRARFWHKGGLISNYVLDLAAVEDPETGGRWVVAFSANTGQTDVAREMGRALARWLKGRL